VRTMARLAAVALAAWAWVLAAAAAPAQEQLVRAELSYAAPGTGPAPNFSPKGTQVKLADVPAGAPLPPGASRPARTGTIEVGPTERSWVGILVSAAAEHPKDLCRLFVDRNRNHDFSDDGPALAAVPSVREKTGDSWSSFATVDLTVPYSQGVTEPYSVSVWIVRQGDEVPSIARYSVRSWRAGTVTIRGVETIVAAMDSDNDAVFDKEDTWSVLEASAPDAAKKVLSIAEAKPTTRMMFVKGADREHVLEFRGFSPDGRTISFAVVDRPVTKAEDRAADDTLAVERARPRAKEPFAWASGFDIASAKAAREKRFLILDFWTSWCGPCKTMDEWIWTDAEVAGSLSASYVGVKLDGDLEKALVSRFKVAGYPTFIILDPAGKEVRRFSGYMSSKQTLGFLNAAPLRRIDLSADTSRQVVVDREEGQYLGHVTTVLLEDGKTMIAVYPKGHGKGAIVMKRSTDGGRTWSARLATPENWATSQEVPTLYRVIDPKSGKKRLILFSGLYPIRLAVSEDDGATWSPLAPVGDWGGIVAMASVERLKNGDYAAFFHDDGRFFRAGGKKTKSMQLYQSISKDGGLTWGEPRLLFSSETVNLCEPGVVRSPDGKQLAMLLRENNRARRTHVMFSNDEAATWSAPREVPLSLTGDRHTAKYAPDVRLFISFRNMADGDAWKGDWVAWVGTYDDIVNGRDGQYLVRLMDNKNSWDSTYPGVEVLPDGTIVTTTYGHWEEGKQPFIVSVRLKLVELDVIAIK